MIANASHPSLPGGPDELKPVAVPVVQAIFLAPFAAGPAAYLAIEASYAVMTAGFYIPVLADNLSLLMMTCFLGYFLSLPVCAVAGTAMTAAALQWPVLRRTWIWVAAGTAVGGFGLAAISYFGLFFVGAASGAACAWLFRRVMRQSFGR